MPEAREGQRVVAAQQLVARLQVDRHVVVGCRTVVDVEVAPVDREPDTAERADDAVERTEVDGNQIVDLHAGQFLDRGQRERFLPDVVGLVDRSPTVARDVDDEVAREREQRDRLRARVDAHHHHRVGAPTGLAGTMVLADDQCGNGLVGRGDGKSVLCLLLLLVGRARHCRNRVLHVPVAVARNAEGHDHDQGADATDYPGPATAALRRFGAVQLHRRSSATTARTTACCCRCRRRSRCARPIRTVHLHLGLSGQRGGRLRSTRGDHRVVGGAIGESLGLSRRRLIGRVIGWGRVRLHVHGQAHNAIRRPVVSSWLSIPLGFRGSCAPGLPIVIRAPDLPVSARWQRRRRSRSSAMGRRSGA